MSWRLIVSRGGPTMFGARGKILGFGVPISPENALTSLVPWIYQCAKAPHFLYYVPWNIHSPGSLKKPTPLPVQLPVQISVTSKGTVLNSKFYHNLFLQVATQWGYGSSYKNLERPFHSIWIMIKKVKEFLCKNSIFIWQALAIRKKLYDEQK